MEILKMVLTVELEKLGHACFSGCSTSWEKTRSSLIAGVKDIQRSPPIYGDVSKTM